MGATVTGPNQSAADAEERGMVNRKVRAFWFMAVLVSFAALPANAQSFRVRCPSSTITHPTAANNNSEPAYNGPTSFTTDPNGQYLVPTPASVNGAIKCQQ